MKNFTKEEIVSFYLDNDVLLSPELLDFITENPLPVNSEFIVLNKEILAILQNKTPLSSREFEKSLVLKQKNKSSKMYDKFQEYLQSKYSQNTFVQEKESSSKNALQSSENLEIRKESKNEETHSSLNVEISKTNTQSSTNILTEDNLTRTESENQESKEAPPKKESEKEKELFFEKNKIKIVSSYTQKAKKWSVQDFVSLYNSRFKDIEKMLRSRQELQSLTSISKILSKKEKENVAIIGCIYEKGLTKAGNIILTVEDPTGMIKVVITQKKEETFKLAQELQLDEIIGITGTFDQIIFASNVYFPDIPLSKELKKSPNEEFFAVISDLEIGNKYFLEKEFLKFVSWINGEIGNDKQKEVASKIKCIFIVGDLVAGVGIYPGQEYDLTILDVRDQYKKLAEYLRMIPDYIPIIFCLGNHDVGRISEPQPPLTEEFGKALLDLPNVLPVSNPSVVNIFADKEKGFDGLDVMLYHGGSFVYYSESLPSVRKSGGQKRPDLLMKYLLQRRHLAPSHTSTLYIPDPKKDPLVIDKIPDFVISGHIHRASVTNYKNITCINASCWGAQTEEQERRGLEPQPARAFIIDAHTREVKIMNFLSKEDQEKEEAKYSPKATETNSSDQDPKKSESKSENTQGVTSG